MNTTFRIAAGIMVATLVLGVAAPDADAQKIRQRTREVLLTGFVDPDGAFGSEWAVDVGYGRFVRDNIEVGGVVGFSDNGRDIKEWSIGGFGELHFLFQFPQTGILPYVGLRVSVVGVEETPVPVPLPGAGDAAAAATAERPIDETALEGTLRPGLKYFLSDAVALDLGIDFSVASTSIYVNDGKLDDTDWGISGGIRAYF